MWTNRVREGGIASRARCACVTQEALRLEIEGCGGSVGRNEELDGSEVQKGPRCSTAAAATLQQLARVAIRRGQLAHAQNYLQVHALMRIESRSRTVESRI
eukprot:1178860-Prorocentrum_minimum.AAC.2